MPTTNLRQTHETGRKDLVVFIDGWLKFMHCYTINFTKMIESLMK